MNLLDCLTLSELSPDCDPWEAGADGSGLAAVNATVVSSLVAIGLPFRSEKVTAGRVSTDAPAWSLGLSVVLLPATAVEVLVTVCRVDSGCEGAVASGSWALGGEP